MKNTTTEAYLDIIKAEMTAEYLKTIDREYIKQIVLRAGGNNVDIDNILKHSSVKEIDDDMFYINISTS